MEAEGTGVGEMGYEQLTASLIYQLCANMIGIGEGRFYFDYSLYFESDELKDAEQILESFVQKVYNNGKFAGYSYGCKDGYFDSSIFFDTADCMINHEKIDMCQRSIGYSSIYDWIFCHGVGGNMDAQPFDFYDENDNLYRLWMWRGYYMGVGTGAEIGIYDNPHKNSTLELFDKLHENESFEDVVKLIDNGEALLDFFSGNANMGRSYFNDVWAQAESYYDASDEYKSYMWDIADFELPMQMYLYEKTDNGYKTIFQWEPKNPQWWIASFDPTTYDVNVKNTVLVAMVDFSGSVDGVDINYMYKALKDTVMKKSSAKDFLIFDDEEQKVWVIWYA